MNSRNLLTWLSNFASFGRPLLPFTLHCCLHSRHSISLTTLLQSAMASYLDLLLRGFIIPNFLLLSLHFGQIRRLCLTCSTGSHAHHTRCDGLGTQCLLQCTIVHPCCSCLAARKPHVCLQQGSGACVRGITRANSAVHTSCIHSNKFVST